MKWSEIWNAQPPRALSLPLSALTAGYRGLLAVRETLYGLGVLQSRRLACPVISVGNLTVGGTGKTPTVELAVRTLQDAGRAAGVVSRGYRRRTKGLLIVADPSGIRLDPMAAGDEPFLLARRLPGTPVVVGENRYQAGRICVERFGVQALVLDDAFQHRTLHKDLEVVTVTGDTPWGNGHLFPRGPLREPLSALARAHLVVVTGPQDSAGMHRIVETVNAHNPAGGVVTAWYEPVECWAVSGALPPRVTELRDLRLYAFAGIARPQNFARTLAELGVRIAGFAEFADHHWYTPRDVEGLADAARASGAQALITTEKDAVRCLGRAPRVPLWALAVRLVLTDGRPVWEAAFRNLFAHESD